MENENQLKEVPDIAFKKQHQEEIEFEVFSLSSLFTRRASFNHMLHREHRIHFYLILLCTEGTGTHWIDFHPYRYENGCILLVAKDQIHAFDYHYQSEGIVILFTEQFLIKNVIHSDILFLHRLFNYHLNTPLINKSEQAGENLVHLIKTIYDEYQSSEEYAKEALLRSYLKILLLKAERIKKRSMVLTGGKSNWIDLFTRFKDLVTTRHRETRNAKDYAASLGVSYKHLNEVTQYATGNSPKKFIDTCLVLEIKRQLTISNLPGQELAFHFNFDEPTNFVKFFKKHTGKTPAQFRRTL